SVTDPLGHVTRSTYDEHGNLTSVVRPDGRELTAEYNALGLPVRVKGADGTITRQTYDERGNLMSVTDASGVTTAYTYDEAGNPVSVTDAMGHTTHVSSDASGLPTEITDPLGAVTHVIRDAYGRPVVLTHPLGGVTRLEWTVEGRLSRRTDADGTMQSWTYDGEGNCLTHTDATGGVTHFEYTHFDLMISRTGPAGVRYEFAHDHALRLIQVRNSQGLIWGYGYDAAGRLLSETDFDNRTFAYECDAAGRLTARTDALGQTIHYERDRLGRIVAKDAAGSVTTFEYDIFDQLARISSPESTVTLLRDRHGRLTSETVDGRTTSYGHDALGRRTRRRTPSGATSTWAYDAAGRRIFLTTSGRALTFEHDAAGQETIRHIGDSLTLANQYDPVGRLTTQHITGPENRGIQRRAYTYRADGHLIGLTDQVSGLKTFDLDPAARITAVHAADWSERYTYDAAGNQTEAFWPASHPSQEAVGTRTYAGTAIIGAGTIHYEHDALGRTTLRQKIRLSRKRDTWRYEWDAENRLTAVTTPDGSRWRYSYDPLGRRTAKEKLMPDGEVMERVSFTWDGDTLCEQTTDIGTLPRQVVLTWDYDGFRPLTQTERICTPNTTQGVVDERFFAIVTDLVGTPTELIDESGEISWHTRSTLWGITTWSADSSTYTPLRFPGQYFDPETGLHYNFHRHYDPDISRYITADPLGLRPGPNVHTYAPSPLTWGDPLGLSPCPHKALTETRESKGSIVSKYPITADEALKVGEEFLGEGYRELGKNRGVFRSADGLRQFRMDQDSLDGNHWPDVPHVHLEMFQNAGDKRPYVNNHVPLIK
ncbi:MAG TPA: type IV secretion protein Rhs, partial [Streptomyces sp.]|nr:type IV secretion protein Rhs [Streptomyces sp.]